MAIPQKPLTKEQLDKFQDAFVSQYLDRPNPFLSAKSGPQGDVIVFRFPWRVRLRRSMDRLLKRIGWRKPDPVTIRYDQILTTIRLTPSPTASSEEQRSCDDAPHPGTIDA